MPNFRVKYYYKSGKNKNTIKALFSINEKEDEKTYTFPTVKTHNCANSGRINSNINFNFNILRPALSLYYAVM